MLGLVRILAQLRVATYHLQKVRSEFENPFIVCKKTISIVFTVESLFL